jgi:hypothetical protein
MGASGGQPWIATRDLIDVGQETIARKESVSNFTMASGTLRLTFFTAKKTEVSTQGRMTTGTTAAAATPTLCRWGYWDVAANGDLTLAAAIANDTTLFAAANLAYPKSWITPWTPVAGRRYAHGLLIVSAAALPSFPALVLASATTSNTAPKLSAQLTGQTDLPSSIPVGSLSGSAAMLYAETLP